MLIHALHSDRQGYADLMVAGGAEAAIDPLTVAGFAKMRALTRSKDPLTASSPFDAGRSGFVIGKLPVSSTPTSVKLQLRVFFSDCATPGEGAGMLVLESMESATRRNANIIAEIVGYGLSGML